MVIDAMIDAMIGATMKKKKKKKMMMMLPRGFGFMSA